MNNNNVYYDDVYATMNKLIIALGEEPKKGNQGKAQLKRVKCYVDFEKTGKLNRQGKESSEIRITEVYEEWEIEENLESLQKAGRPTIYAQWFYEWLASYNCKTIISKGENQATTSTLKEFIYDSGLTNKDSRLLDTYVDVDIWLDMSTEERRVISRKKEYIFALTEVYKHKILSALKKIKDDYPTFEYRTTYKITEDEEREEWYEALPEEVEIIKSEIKNCQAKMVENYGKSFNVIKFDVVLYDEYNKMLQQSLLDLLGIYGHVWAITIEPCDEIINIYNDFKSVMNIDNNVKPTICELMGKCMENILSKKGYDQNKHNNKKSVLGNKESKIVQWIFTLKYCEEVINLHTQLFGEINEEVVYGNDELEYGLYKFAKNKKKKRKQLIAEQKTKESVLLDADYDEKFPF